MSQIPQIPTSSGRNHFNLEIASISTCNMACTYCFEGDELKSKKKQPTQNIEHIISKMETLLTDQKFMSIYNGICLNFWGGEPTLNYEWNKELITQTKIKFPGLVSYFFYSNGYSLEKVRRHLDLFSENEHEDNTIRLQISWDGVSNGRVNHSNEATNDKVQDHIIELAKLYPKLNLMTKATIQPEELLHLEDLWLGYHSLFVKVNSINSRVTITFSPTLNYVDDYAMEQEYLNKLSINFGKVLKLEEAFYDKYRFHLFGWFSMDHAGARVKRMTNCSAGINLAAIDYDGNLSVCHGTLYSPLKKDFISFQNTNIKDSNEDFKVKLFKTREELQKSHSYIADECINCTATVCYKCPVVNLEQLNDGVQSENFQKRDPRHCSIYKLFGKFDRLLINIKVQKYKEVS